MSKSKGYIKIYRDMLDNPTVFRDAEYAAIWMYLLLHARATPTEVRFGGEKITLNPGQLTTGRKKIASDLRVTESKVQRVLKCFESEHQIEQRTDRQCRLITICSWNEYQVNEQRNEQQMNNERTTSEQRVNTKKERKERKERKECNNKTFVPPTLQEVQDYIAEKGYRFDAEAFIAYYESNGWKVGRNKMTSWKSACVTWEKRNDNRRFKGRSEAEEGSVSSVQVSAEALDSGWENIFGSQN